ncbi:rod shape-determining protein MreC [Chlamydia sp. 17-3921]|uniref:rod shape-determining protein MreC n=1 Tax=Chlamydia sp. 17-3921 TaxID=2675798 RepID=UPI0019181EAA|nr:rod shape-determining protein MreC [Chlamydia sp. 17-3921]
MNYLNLRNKRIKFFIYLTVGVGILCCWSIPKEIYESFQKYFVSVHSRIFFKSENSSILDNSYLEIENLLLKEQIEDLKERVLLMEASQHPPPLFPTILSPYFCKLIEGRVIYRDSTHWSNSCWVNVGKNQGVQRNSAVLSKNVLVGLVDYVGDKQSRIRLITDIGMNPSVVALRGNIQIWWVKQKLKELINLIEWLPHTYIVEKDKYEKISQLKELSSLIQSEESNQELLRGTLSGMRGSLWKQETTLLRGEGFCFSDGKTLLPGDFLVTTGLDGIFPPGLPIAKISKVFFPRDGACAFNIEAESLASNISALSHLFILPPMEFNPNDRPDIFGLLWD